jgi:hypothetical protein
MIPRRDPEIRTAATFQLIPRRDLDPYGSEAGFGAHGGGRRASTIRPVQTRNGIPAPRYCYRGTGESMTETEAAYWLRMNVAPGRPLNPHPGATQPKGDPPQ